MKKSKRYFPEDQNIDEDLQKAHLFMKNLDGGYSQRGLQVEREYYEACAKERELLEKQSRASA